ncbi:MAG: histone deacetylase family protein, partial [Actinomycetota bacterium]
SGVAFDLVEPAPADRADVVRVHTREYLDWLKSYCAGGGGWIDADTPAGSQSMEVALRAAGACCAAVDAALQTGRRAFCMVRPPGHHARPDRAMGFCLINNVAVAAARAAAGGIRPAIVDFDVHHGNGTQEMFYEDPRVLYVSIHQWPWYPWENGDLEYAGEGPARGSNVNIPMPEASGDEVYLEAFDRIVTPVLQRFGPEMLIVSAGFDAHASDPLGGQAVTGAGFAAMSALLVSAAEDLCGGRVFFALEGGYNLDVLKEAAPAVMAALGGNGPAHKGETGEKTEWLDPIAEFHLKRR